MSDFNPVHIVGGGLAGCEAAFQLASNGVQAVIHEMRPIRKTEAHQGEGLAELVCSNSFRSDDATANAVGVLHQEMRLLGSLIMNAADYAKIQSALGNERETHIFMDRLNRPLI